MHPKTLDEVYAAVPTVSEVDRVIARNLRALSGCGRERLDRMLFDPDGEEELAALVAKVTLGIRENESGLVWMVSAAREEVEAKRQALETVAANCHAAVLALPAAARAIIEKGLGRPL